jgi:hypothetical protein
MVFWKPIVITGHGDGERLRWLVRGNGMRSEGEQSRHHNQCGNGEMARPDHVSQPDAACGLRVGLVGVELVAFFNQHMSECQYS